MLVSIQGEFARGLLYRELLATKKDSHILACRLVVGELKQRLDHAKHIKEYFKKAILHVDSYRTWGKEEQTNGHIPIKLIIVMKKNIKNFIFLFSTQILDREELQLRQTKET